jgi:hypothetical protein
MAEMDGDEISNMDAMHLMRAIVALYLECGNALKQYVMEREAMSVEAIQVSIFANKLIDNP